MCVQMDCREYSLDFDHNLKRHAVPITSGPFYIIMPFTTDALYAQHLSIALETCTSGGYYVQVIILSQRAEVF